MYKTIILIFLIVLNFPSIIAQNIIVTYENNSFGGRLSYEGKLLISEKNSQYSVSYESFTIEENGRELEFHGKNYMLNYKYLTKEFTELRFLDKYEVKANWLNKQEWEILDETKTILGYTVRKAQIKLDNQMMYAWFTNEIPVPSGPYKNTGLPGLILEIYYSKQNTTCVATHIKFNVDEDLKDFSNAYIITKQELQNLENNKRAIKKRIKKGELKLN